MKKDLQQNGPKRSPNGISRHNNQLSSSSYEIFKYLRCGIRLVEVKICFFLKHVTAPQDLDPNTPDAIALIPYLISQNDKDRINRAQEHYL